MALTAGTIRAERCWCCEDLPGREWRVMRVSVSGWSWRKLQSCRSVSWTLSITPRHHQPLPTCRSQQSKMKSGLKKVPIHLTSAQNRLIIKNGTVVNCDGEQQVDVYMEVRLTVGDIPCRSILRTRSAWLYRRIKRGNVLTIISQFDQLWYDLLQDTSRVFVVQIFHIFLL